MGYACAMPPLPDADAKAALRSRRRWLAKRRCLRALRATIAFMVLVTPFLYFGYILCCRMPFGIGNLLPNWILLYECWMFARNAYIFFRHLFTTPILAALPLLINIYFIVEYPPGPYTSINENSYFELFKENRLEIIKKIENRSLADVNSDFGIINLNQPYTHLAMQNGEVIFRIKNDKACVVFSTGWNFFSFDRGFCYIPDDVPANWLGMDRLSQLIKIEKMWYIIIPDFDYLQNILDTPPK